MNSYKAIRSFKTVFFLALITFSLGIQASTKTSKPHSGFQIHLVYIASGFDNCTGGNDSCQVVDGLVVDDLGRPVADDHFERYTMGRDDIELSNYRNAALQFFADRFGGEIISGVSSVNNAAEVLFWVEQNMFPFTLDPRTGYRAIAISKQKVPTEGFIVRDGGWQLVLNGRVGVFGEYSIQTKKKVGDAFGQHKSDLILHYQSQNLINFNPNPVGPTAFDCELWLGDYDLANPQMRGFAQGVFNPSSPVANIRNVLTLNHVNLATYPGLGTN